MFQPRSFDVQPSVLQQSSSVAEPMGRRLFLQRIAGASLAAAALALTPGIAYAEPAGTQSNWRYCVKCHSLFYDFADKGHCAAGGGHEAVGLNYILAHDVTLGQRDWRYCIKCHVLYYAKSPTQSRCPVAGPGSGPGQHVPVGLNYCLPQLGEAPGQSDWRFCSKCHGLFYNDKYPAKGHCPAGGGHSALGWNFSLDFLAAGSLATIHEYDYNPIVFKSGVPVGGRSHLTLYPDGQSHFTGHFHVSGAGGWDVAAACMVITRTGHGYLFAKQGHVNGTLVSGSRDFDWEDSTPDPKKKELLLLDWADLAGGKAVWKADVGLDLGGIIDSVKKAAEAVQAIVKVIEVVAA